jgi:predicted Zn-dependent protease
VEHENYDRARQEYLAIISQIPLNVSPYLALSRLCLKEGMKEEAATYLRRVLELDPGNGQALDLMHRVEEQR